MKLDTQTIYNKHQVNTQESKITNKNTSYNKDTMPIENDSKYNNAPEFKAFIQKWMNKGDSEIIARERATFYAQAGLLEYGDLKLEDLEYGNKKHGLNLINNNVLKNAILETFDSLDNEGVGILVRRLFKHDVELNPDKNKDYESIAFQELIDEFASKLNKLGGLYNIDDKKYSNYKDLQFDGNINILENMSQLEKNFIYDTLVEYFKEHINKISLIEQIHNEPWTEAKDAFNVLISNFEKKVSEENDNHKALNQYTKNNKPIPY